MIELLDEELGASFEQKHPKLFSDLLQLLGSKEDAKPEYWIELDNALKECIDEFVQKNKGSVKNGPKYNARIQKFR